MKVNPGQPFLEMFMDSWCFMINSGGGMLAVMQEQELRASACLGLISAVKGWLGSSPHLPLPCLLALVTLESSRISD